MALLLVIDDERFAATKATLAKRKKGNVRAIARITKPAWLFSKKNAVKMAEKKWDRVSVAKRRRLAKRAAKARWAAVRKNRGTLLASGQAASSVYGGPAASALKGQMVLGEAKAQTVAPALSDAACHAAPQ
jgi:hypothetical protein